MMASHQDLRRRREDEGEMNEDRGGRTEGTQNSRTVHNRRGRTTPFRRPLPPGGGIG